MNLLQIVLNFFSIYRLYEKWLYMQIRHKEIPQHVAIILDGNRRWARKRNLPVHIGHIKGAEKLKELIKWCVELGVRYLTVFVFSTENFNREEDEINEFIKLMRKKLDECLNDENLMRYSIRIKFIGDVQRLPEDIREKIHLLEDKTKSNTRLVVNVALAYGGKWDILTATKIIATLVKEGKLNVEDISYETFQKFLATSHLPKPDVDLLLRTGGEYRISNFLLWQCAYAELVFMDIMWPDFRKIDFMRAIRLYQKRNRRFGR
ncbi:MAG: polyprenyl diphosphate synthase [Candidatus Geothermarchaeota archaeon]